MPENDELKKYLDYDGLAYLLQRFPKTTVHCTFDSEFAGETATLTHGTTTYTKTVPATSPFELTFAVNELGTWTLQSSYLGTQYSDTVDITYLGQKGEVELTIVPNGSTAEPVNSIPVWLKCANLNKSYTTLAEVLADTETYETLLADSNACQYMKRSTAWINPGLVPKMTSRTTPEGIADANSEYSSTFQAWKAFDGTNIGGAASASVDCWASTGPNEFPKYLQYMFATPKIVRRVKVTTRNTDTATDINSPKEVTLKAYNGTSYDTLGTFTNTEATTSNTSFEFTVNNDTAYQYYMLEINSINKTTTGTGNTDYYCCIGQMQYYEYADPSIVDSQDAMARLGKFDYASNLLSNDPTWAEAIGTSDYMDYVWDTSVPNMTGYTAPSGRVYASSENNNVASYAWNAFSTSNNYNWDAIQNSSLPQWLAYEFPYPVIVKKARVCSFGNRLTKVKIQGSNDGFTNDVHDLTEEVSVSQDYNNPTVLLIPTNTSSYTSYRFLGTESGQNSGGWRSLSGEGGGCNFYGRASEEVLVPLVPTMTSNTTPSGEVIYSSVYSTSGFEAYKAFDNNTSTRWNGDNNLSTAYIGYKFTRPVCVNKVTFHPYYSNGGAYAKDYIVQGSNDGFVNDVHELYSGTHPNSDTTSSVTFNNNNEYLYYRLYLSTTYRDGYSLWDVQFYQRTVQTNIIHSAANDTIYMLEDGDPIVLATTNSDGDGILDFSQLSAGSVTLYSSVAKSPEDLTADYSKTITITKTQYGGTTELYLMPDTVKTLYWWGNMANSGGFTNRGGTAATKTLTLNTYDIEVNVTSGTCAVGTNQTINTDGFTKLCGITKATNKGITFISSPTLGSAPQNDGYGRTGILSQNNAIEKLQADLTNTGDVYTYIFQSLATNQTSKSNTYALWYE